MTRIEYIKLFGPYMIEALKGKKLFPSVMMAQTLLERAGKDGVPEGSLLASKYNNHFGTKADAFRESGKVALRTNGFIKGERFTVKQLFRVYESVQQSFDDRIQFLLRNTASRKVESLMLLVLLTRQNYYNAAAMQQIDPVLPN
ncbi:MAG: glucosaminidase domain-containing protein [Chryseolinea sp.]